MAGFRSFLFPEARVEGGRAILDARESYHLVRVLRARKGAAVEVLDGRGRRSQGRLAEVDAKAAAIEIEREERVEAPKPALALVQALPKGKTTDLILRMATEVGAARIAPVFTEHGEMRIEGGRLAAKMEKWRTTMIESCKQCGLPFLPELLEPVALPERLAQLPAGSGTLGLVGSLEAGSRPLAQVLGEASGGWEEVVVAVGPEGDFSEAEYALLRDSGFQPVRLGANVLRAETAAAYLMSVVDQLLRSE